MYLCIWQNYREKQEMENKFQVSSYLLEGKKGVWSGRVNGGNSGTENI